MVYIKRFPEKTIKEYKKYLDEEASKFRLTAEDLGNLFDLQFMIDTPKEVQQDFFGTLKLNNMDKWFTDFFKRIEKIVIPELNNKPKEIKNENGWGRPYGYKDGKEALERLRNRNTPGYSKVKKGLKDIKKYSP